VSPRLGISYPITDNSNFRVNFAMMFKMPEMRILYDNAYGFAARGNQIFGNPDIDPQKVIIYDLGYEASINNNFFVDISAFYRDIFNQSGVTYIPAVPASYVIQTVQEYGNVRGLEATLEMRPSGPDDHISARLNYTLQRAAGTASSPTSNYGTLIGAPDPYTGEKRDNPLTEFPLSYDQTHSFNGTISFFWQNDQGPTLGGLHVLENTNISLTALLGTGGPYTRVNTRGEQVGEFNANRFPSSFNSEARLGRTIFLSDIFGESFGNTNLELYVTVSNVFNTTGPVSYYTTTGNPDQNGTSLNRGIGEFPATPYFDKEDPNRPETYGTGQFDRFGTRYYNPYADLNLDGVVTQSEKYAGYQRLVATIQSLRGNYDQPRTFSFGARLRF
ncbi:MAG: TonB-dependent receptor, partial [Candidatus Kapaibacterium sp.]